MTELWFTRVTLNRAAPDIAPLIGRLLPETGSEGEKLNATHQLLWTLMPEAMQQAGKPGRPEGGDKAAFLWRAAERANSWYMLGPEPRRQSPFFTVETTPYALAMQAGDRLSFDMVANATVDRMIDPSKGRDGRKRCDVVMDALKAEERAAGATGDRAARRQALAAEALSAWMAGQGGRNGFDLAAFDLVSYRTVEIDRPRTGPRRARSGGRPPLMGVGHIRGLITVSDPAAFAAKVATGFGRAKAFGCGLVLLRRVT